jgi:hypothetical protein
MEGTIENFLNDAVKKAFLELCPIFAKEVSKMIKTQNSQENIYLDVKQLALYLGCYFLQ